MANTLFETEIKDLMAQHASAMIVDLDSGEIKYASKTVEEIFGVTVRNSMEGKKLEDYLTETSKAIYVTYREKYSKSLQSPDNGHVLDVKGMLGGCIEVNLIVYLAAEQRRGIKYGISTVLQKI